MCLEYLFQEVSRFLEGPDEKPRANFFLNFIIIIRMVASLLG